MSSQRPENPGATGGEGGGDDGGQFATGAHAASMDAGTQLELLGVSHPAAPVGQCDHVRVLRIVANVSAEPPALKAATGATSHRSCEPSYHRARPPLLEVDTGRLERCCVVRVKISPVFDAPRM